MKGSDLLHRIDALIDQGNMVWENPGSNADRDVALFCSAVKDLVVEIYGPEHPYIEKHAAATRDLQHDLGGGMTLLTSMRKEAEGFSPSGH